MNVIDTKEKDSSFPIYAIKVRRVKRPKVMAMTIVA